MPAATFATATDAGGPWISNTSGRAALSVWLRLWGSTGSASRIASRSQTSSTVQPALRAALAATAYRTDEYGPVPLSRRRVRELTGVPESTQRRYENKHGHAATVEAVHVELDPRHRRRHYPGMGLRVFPGRHVPESRRLPDASAPRYPEKPRTHQPGSASAARRANQHLAKSARGDRPATKGARGTVPSGVLPSVSHREDRACAMGEGKGRPRQSRQRTVGE